MKEVLNKRLEKLKAHYKALKDYHDFIIKLGNIYEPFEFSALSLEERAVLEAYLKRFSSVQDYLGAKIFPLLLDVKGIPYKKMSEVLSLMEKEEIINLEEWIEFRNVRNELEHDYPDEIKQALEDLKFCVENFEKIEEIIKKVFEYVS
ncbi:hypothetical protein [Caminibacter pacificus]|jgi:hypothetical protein|uniref:Nucleotidyltransferase substrate binding protein, HI0074 family n=1 Tax=Caminibacter pacificus TaxID=1424653 RepID=A0AAJ4REA2_9BACT|nr:hypothetical protein [Caminibacter pacificus]NPA87810.1 hypothetical protein [Campylobacterota bacterium]QCI28174.1 hypothetical protein C6V80_04145 [Caminibacter pacificus]ROR41113.1 hypothetical protein EDC58_0597 [Caminibacter pacificus]